MLAEVLGVKWALQLFGWAQQQGLQHTVIAHGAMQDAAAHGAVHDAAAHGAVRMLQLALQLVDQCSMLQLTEPSSAAVR